MGPPVAAFTLPRRQNPPRSVHVAGKNHILESLPAEVRARLLKSTERFAAERKHVVFERKMPIEFVHFPLASVVSLVSNMQNGDIAEVATVGNEGLIGLPLALGVNDDPHDAFYQVPGETLRMPAAVFIREIAKRGALEAIVRRYTQAFCSQIARSAACNLLHPVEQRLCRWILMCHDRVGDQPIRLTQEFIAQMLGVRRPTVTLVASVLQKAGFIRYKRGVIEVLDRPGLEEACCDCYRFVRNEFERLLC